MLLDRGAKISTLGSHKSLFIWEFSIYADFS